MDPSDIEVAVQISWNAGGDTIIQAQALNFVNNLRSKPQAWSPCLTLFTRINPPASDPVKHYCLEVVCNCIPQLDREALEHIKEQLIAYVQANYAGDTTPRDTSAIQNKFCQALTALFVQLYPTTWQSFFFDFLALTKNGTNVPGTLLYFRLLLSIHEEIADIIIHRGEDATKRNITLKDLVRDRDAEKVAVFWHQMLARRQDLDALILDLCLKSIGRWISWSDISLVVNEIVLNSLLELAGQQVSHWMVNETKVRDTALETFTEIASKKMRPAEKVELIGVLKLDTVISGLIESPALKEQSRPDYDTDLAELVAKLVNNIIRDIVVVLDSSDSNEQTRQQAHRILLTFLPFMLRFFSDDYDEVCSTVMDGFSEVLSFLRRLKDPAAAAYSPLLPTFLQRIVAKMKYDDSTTWSDIEEANEPDFIDFRRRLQTLQKQVFAINEPMTIGGISDLVQHTFRKLAENPSQVDWADVDLAMYELHAFGDFAVKSQPTGGRGGGYAWEQLGVMMEQMMSFSKFLGSKVCTPLTLRRGWQLQSPLGPSPLYRKLCSLQQVL
jgi:exportin-T